MRPFLLRLGLPLLLAAGFLQPVLAERKAVSPGMVLGLAGSSYWGEDVKTFQTEIRPTAGLTLAFHLPALLGLEVDLLYASKGGRLKNQDSLLRVQAITAHSLEIPLLLKVTAPTVGEVHPVFVAGASYGYLFRRRTGADRLETSPSGTLVSTPTEPQIPLEALTDRDISLVLGGGLEWGLGTLQLRFNLGRESLDTRGEQDVKTLLISALAGFLF